MTKHDEGLVRHGILLMAAAQISSVCNILFHSAMGRMLPGPEYGILSPMLAIMLIIGTPLEALRTAFAHYAARAVQDNDRGADARLRHPIALVEQPYSTDLFPTGGATLDDRTITQIANKQEFQAAVKPVWDKYGAQHAALIQRIQDVK